MLVDVNNWLQGFGNKHSIVESRFPAALGHTRKAVVLEGTRCRKVYSWDYGRYLCAEKTSGTTRCLRHGNKNEIVRAGAPKRAPKNIRDDAVIAFMDGVWVDVNSCTRVDNNEPVDFVDDILIW